MIRKKFLNLTWRVLALLKRTLKRYLITCACSEGLILSGFSRILIRHWNYVLLEGVETFSSSHIARSIVLENPTSFTVEAPLFIDKPSEIREGTFPELSAHVLKGGTVSAYSSAVLLDRFLLFPKSVFIQRNRVLTDGEGLFEVASSCYVGRRQVNDILDAGILVGGAGAFNWYHFVIECLPKAYLAQRLPIEYRSFPLIVPDECRYLPSYADALSLFTEGRELQFVSRKKAVLVNDLIVFDEISVGPFDLVVGQWPQLDDYSQQEIVLKKFIEVLRTSLLANRNGKLRRFSRRIMLTRPGVRRNFNQAELVNIARRYGFEAISPEALSLQEQAEIFSNASHVVGPSGAAWVGMIFNDSGIRGLSWLPQVYREFCGYSSLARLLNHNLSFIEARPSRELRSTGDAYTSPYYVCPIEFESAIQSLILGA